MNNSDVKRTALYLSEQEARQMQLREAQRRAVEIDQGQVRLISAEELERQVDRILACFLRQ